MGQQRAGERNTKMNIPTTHYEDLLNEFSSETSFEKQKKKSASGNKRFQK